MEEKDYRSLLKILKSDSNHYEKFEKSQNDFKNERLNILSKGDFLFRKILRDKKNDQILLKKKLLVLGVKPEQIINGETEDREFQKKENEKNKLKLEITNLQKKLKTLEKIKIDLTKKKISKTTSKKNLEENFEGVQKIYLLGKNLEKDETSHKLLRLINILQKQISDSKKELSILEGCLDSKKKEQKLINNFLSENELKENEIFEKKNENLQNLIDNIQQENSELENQLKNVMEIFKEEQKKKIDLDNLNGKIEKNNRTDFDEEIELIEKRICNFENNLKELSNENHFKSFDKKKKKNQKELEKDNKVLQKELFNLDIKIPLLQKEKEEKLDFLKNLKDEEKTKNLELAEKKMCLENGVNFTKFHQKANEINDKKKDTEKIISETNKHIEREIFLGDLGDNLNKRELEILNLRINPEKNGYYFYQEGNGVFFSEIDKKKNIENEIERALKVRADIANQIEKYRKHQKTSFLVKDNIEEENEEIKKQNFVLEKLKKIISNKKKVLKVKIEKEDNLTESDIIQNSFSEKNTNLRIKNRFSKQNVFQVFLGDFEIFEKYQILKNIKNPKIVASLNFYDFETSFTELKTNFKDNFNSQFEFPITIDINLLNYFYNRFLLLEIFVENQQGGNHTFTTKIYLKDFVDKNKDFYNFPFVWKNRQILNYGDIEAVGFLDTSIRFKINPVFAITLIESDFDDLTHFDKLLNPKDNLIQNNNKTLKDNNNKNEITEIKTKCLQENQIISKNKEKKNILIKIEKIEGKIYCEKVFIFYEINGGFFTTESLEVKNPLIVNYTNNHSIDLEKKNKIKFVLFDDSEILENQDNDVIGFCELDILPSKDDSPINQTLFLVDSNNTKLKIKISFVVLFYD